MLRTTESGEKGLPVRVDFQQPCKSLSWDITEDKSMGKKRSVYLNYLCFLVIFIFFFPLRANSTEKFWGGVGYWNDPLSATISQQIINRINRENLLKSVNAERVGQGLPPLDADGNEASSNEPEPPGLSFIPKQASIVPSTLAMSFADNPEDQAKWKKILKRYLRKRTKRLAKKGILMNLAEPPLFL